MQTIYKDTKGIAVAAIAFVISALLSVLITGGLLFSSFDLKLTSNLKVSDAALQVADAAVHHALAVIPTGMAFDEYASITQIIPKPPATSTSYTALPGYSYSVSAVNASPSTRAILTATAWGPNNAKKVVRAYVKRGGYGFGAVHLPGAAVNIETEFDGTSFSVNGNDRCTTAPAPQPSVPGITTTDPATVTEITNNTTADGGLTSDQMGIVTGAGGAPSVMAINSSTMVSDLAIEFLNQEHTPVEGRVFSGNQEWGTESQKRITLVYGNSEISVSGNVTGHGVLILDGSIRIAGNFTFHGLVIARGDVQFMGGNAKIYGSLLIAESADLDPTVELQVAGNAVVQFDSCALSAVEAWLPLPMGAQLVAWQEVM